MYAHWFNFWQTIAFKNIAICTININSFIFKIPFVTMKGVCMHFTCNET